MSTVQFDLDGDSGDKRIIGNTDGTKIGNVGDRLKVDASVTVSAQSVPSISSKFRALYSASPINTTGAAYTNIYTTTGSGYFWGFRLLLNQDGGQVRLTVDGEVLFQDITSKNISDMNLASVNFEGGFLHRTGAGSYYFSLSNPIRYTSSLQIAVKRDNNGALTTNSYLIYITNGE